MKIKEKIIKKKYKKKLEIKIKGQKDQEMKAQIMSANGTK